MIAPEPTSPLDETVWAWDGACWWRVADKGHLRRVRWSEGPPRGSAGPTSAELARGKWVGQVIGRAVEEVMVMHLEHDRTRCRFEGDLGSVVVISDAFKEPCVERWTVGKDQVAVGWREGAPMVLVMGMADVGEEVGNGASR